MYESTKTWGHDVGMSCCFRQPGADSHCNRLHGYPLSTKLTFQCSHLDNKNWVVDFGALKSYKAWLESMFDHKTVITYADPHLDWFHEAHRRGIIDLVTVEAVGCEAFAKLCFDRAELWLEENNYSPRVWVASAEVREHGANSAIYVRNEK